VSVTAPEGFVASGIACGIKADGRPDLALVATADHRPVPAVAVFTSNRATAAPVEVTRAHLAATGGRAAAVVLNSGNANAATGDQGLVDAERSCALVAAALGCRTEEVLVCSTGLIGIPLPMAPIERGIEPLVAALARDGGGRAAEAIMTTDTHAKEVVVRADGCTVGGMAKGAAMLAPNMATMLAVLTTDGTITRAGLQAAVEHSFNSLSVDGCTSTNDTVIVLATGAQRVDAATPVAGACRDLAEQMAGDAEGATKVAVVRVTGARTDDEARHAARRVAQSQLVKCSLFGADPYWGRVVSELGSAGVEFELGRVCVAYGGIVVCEKGAACPHDDAAVRAHLGQRHVEITADLGLGTGHGTILTNDLTPGYIDENMRTS
jgi:glutamate N-acetyltransferase/amino-acid N-acetyltransferase